MLSCVQGEGKGRPLAPYPKGTFWCAPQTHLPSFKLEPVKLGQKGNVRFGPGPAKAVKRQKRTFGSVGIQRIKIDRLEIRADQLDTHRYESSIYGPR